MEKENRHPKANKSEQGQLGECIAVSSSADEIYDIIAQQLVKYRNRKDRVNPLVLITTQGG